MNYTELSVKTTLHDIEEKRDKNNNSYFKITAQWGIITQTLYAFSSDFNLVKETLEILTNAPVKFINRLVLITYQEQSHKDSQGIFFKVKEIQLV